MSNNAVSSTQAVTTARIITKILENTFQTMGLSLIGIGSIIGINKMTGSTMFALWKLLDKVVIKTPEEAGKQSQETSKPSQDASKQSQETDKLSQVTGKSQESFFNVTLEDVYNYGESMFKTVCIVGLVVGSGIIFKKAGAAIGSEEVVNFFDTERRQ